MLATRALALLAFASLAACAAAPPPRPEAKPIALTGQSFREALALMCEVDRLGSVPPELDPLGASALRSAWITANVDHPDAIELRTLMSVKGAADQAEMLRCKATEAGIARCALADTLASAGGGGLAP